MTDTPWLARRRTSAKSRSDLLVAERRGRLVHHDDAGIEGQGAGDLDDLPLGDRQRRQRPASLPAPAPAPARQVAAACQCTASSQSTHQGPQRGSHPSKTFIATKRIRT